MQGGHDEGKEENVPQLHGIQDEDDDEGPHVAAVEEEFWPDEGLVVHLDVHREEHNTDD